MRPVSGCCSPQELHDYIAGQASRDESERIAQHVRLCDSCWAYVRSLQTPSRIPNTPTFDVTLVGSSEPKSQPNPASFLAPSTDADELGWLSHYRVLRVLGQGGMGLVFEAEDTHLQRLVALKVILPELAAEGGFRERFLREARTMAKLSHENIVTVYQVGVGVGRNGKEEIPYLAMELLQGQTLEQRITREGRLKPAEAARLGQQIAEGLAAAHQEGLIHRDIKPANIFLANARRASATVRRLTPEDLLKGSGPNVESTPRVNVKILDFGLARWQEKSGNLSSTGQIIGTPHYMAPEQAEGLPLDAKADLFSLGALLYNALTGTRPFDGSTTMAVLTALAVRDPKPIRDLVPETPPALADLIQQMLSKDPKQRPESAHAVADALGAINFSPSAITPPPTAAPPKTDAAPRRSRKAWIPYVIGAGVLLVLAASAINLWRIFGKPDQVITLPVGEPIKVGILHSNRGTMRESERPVVDMTRLVLDEINAQGGLLGRPIEYVLGDGESNEKVFAREAERLIAKEKVCVLFGCWTSASRKEVKAVVEERNHLLIYPVQYEGLEESPNIVYTGAAPNQQLLPAIDWCFKKNYRKFFLVGSDYVFPRAANEIMSDKIKQDGGQVVGTEYLILGTGTNHTDKVVDKLIKAKPDVILNTINGDTNKAFYQSLRAKGVTPQQIPTISFSLDKSSLGALEPRLVVGDYAAWNYFQSIPGEPNTSFVKKFRDRYGNERDVTDPMEAAYLGVKFWANAVTEAGTTDVNVVLRMIGGQMIQAPEGPKVRIDPQTRHTWKYFRLGQLTEKGDFEIVEAHDSPTLPMPYPPSRTPEQWNKLLQGLYKGWGNRWSNPGP